ncbi:hypothetical protein ACJIZ3_019495 [Penstemon smallii]|uniref:RRM domain-containing protein n=1 Tax=Penstemon smallii TaxID=265156 RepID=A0ABD3T1Z7_9LAMI
MDIDACSREGKDLQPPISSPNWTINVSDIRTVRVSNVSLAASERDILEFFSFSGDIQYIEMQRETQTTQCAYVTFTDSQGADTAMLLTGATIAQLPVSVAAVENYQLPPNAPPLNSKEPTSSTMTGTAVRKAEDVVSTMLAKGFVLGKGALNKAMSFDQKHNLTSNASSTVASIDHKIGLSEKVRMMDERFQVSEITKTAFTAAEQKASSAGNAILSNRYVSTGASWVSNAISAVSKAAEGVSVMTKEKVEKVEEERRVKEINDYTNAHLDETPRIVVTLADEGKIV